MKPCGYAVVCPCQHFITQNITKWPFSFYACSTLKFPFCSKMGHFSRTTFCEICNATSLTAKVAAASFLWADTPTQSLPWPCQWGSAGQISRDSGGGTVALDFIQKFLYRDWLDAITSFFLTRTVPDVVQVHVLYFMFLHG